ncbi:serine/threonine protein kinase [Sandaracinobacter neustonicus]|uniref:Serine/threonine protein kinase n=1 Tax=Sandaracinobacter neustonicus TaxID=1715348 RepID=A0A501XT95_9SPHN|nr:serine/threonine-protein kinase [Sandaracinobacter neustonicus]TPE63307.1 serine/threonine protein kinase [Sandaracinobacter neustonicus]
MVEPGNPEDPRLPIEREALALFDELLDVPETSRARWIADRTANSDVRARLESMLEADRIASMGTGNAQALRTGAAAIGIGGDGQLPDRIGQYRILALIGRGGMGAVYRATRDTGDFAHETAIKVIKPGLLSDVLTQRFRAERQTLATLQHPNIARLYDGGETESGSPYIVMELIEGLPVDKWANQQSLDTPARVRLVETGANAISYAHGRLVIHRDITPLNLLVQTDGTLKLIDFGIARPADAEGATTATDIVGLGRLLKRLIPEPEPELAAIIARATAPAEQAYPTAAALAADLAAWRSGQPVAAMSGGELYRLRKFAARNRIAVAASALALAVLVGGLIAVSVANARIRRAEAEAEARFEQTRAIANALLFDVYDDVSKVQGATRARETLAKTAISYLEALAAMESAPPDVRAEAGRGFVRLAEVTGGGQQQSLGRYADANALLSRAEALLAPAFAADPQDRSTALAFATLRLEQAGTNLYNNNKADAARAQAAEAEQAVAAFTRADAEAAALAITAIQAQGDSFGWNDDYAAALPQHQRAEALIAALPPQIQSDPEVRSARSANLRLLAEAHHKLKQAPEARAALDQAVAINRSLLAEKPEDPALLRKLAVSLWYSAVVHRTNEQDSQARTAIEEAVRHADRMAAMDTNDAGALQMQAITGEVLAQVHADRRDAAASKAATARVLAAHDRLVELAGNAPGARRSRTAALRTSAGNLYNLGDIPGACRAWRDTLASYRALEAEGNLSELDRKNALPETRDYIRNFCEGGTPRSAWPKSL